jgi:hypothetical protein
MQVGRVSACAWVGVGVSVGMCVCVMLYVYVHAYMCINFACFCVCMCEQPDIYMLVCLYVLEKGQTEIVLYIHHAHILGSLQLAISPA